MVRLSLAVCKASDEDYVDVQLQGQVELSADSVEEISESLAESGLCKAIDGDYDDAQVLGEEAANREAENIEDDCVSLHELLDLNHLAFLKAVFEECVFLCLSRILSNCFG